MSNSETPAAHLARLKTTYPTWKIWKGHVTGEFWAMPPAGHERLHLVHATSLEQLEARLIEAERQ